MTKDNNKYLKALHWGIMHEPQANLEADQKFSPGRSKSWKGGLDKN